MYEKDKLFKKLQDSTPGRLSGVTTVNGIDRAIRRWKRSLKDSNVITETFDRKEYKKPSVLKRLQKNKAIFIQSKKEADNQ